MQVFFIIYKTMKIMASIYYMRAYTNAIPGFQFFKLGPHKYSRPTFRRASSLKTRSTAALFVPSLFYEWNMRQFCWIIHGVYFIHFSCWFANLPSETQTHFVFHFGTGVRLLWRYFSIFVARNVLMFSKTNWSRVVPNVYGRLAREVCKLE